MSGIYIPGWEDPMYCNACPFNYDGICFLNDDITCTYAPVTRAADCPLIPVHNHGRLGDLDKLENNLRLCAKYQTGDRQLGILGCCWTIRSAPTVIPADKEASE